MLKNIEKKIYVRFTKTITDKKLVYTYSALKMLFVIVII